MTTPKKKKILPKTNIGDIVEGFGPAGGIGGKTPTRVIRATNKPSYKKTWNEGYKTGAKKHRYEIADQLSLKGSHSGRYSNQVTKAQMNEAMRTPLSKSKLQKTKKLKIQQKFRKTYPDYMDD